MSDANAAITAVTIMGPTASGKTDLAVRLAERYPFEIISVDSAMVYRSMDIGTAKPPRELLARIPHHLIDIRDPAESYSAASFRDDVVRAATDIAGRGRVPLLVGGTMLYFKALKDGLADMPAADPLVRAKIQALAEAKGWPAVHARLADVDPEAAARLGQNDSSRLQRALEIFEITGQPMSEIHRRGSEPSPLNLVEFSIMPDDRAALHEAIASRFSAMLEAGLVEEVRSLFERGDLRADMPAIKAVGYRQVWAHLAGEMDFDEMTRRGVIATRQLAKRQYTWLRSWRGHLSLPLADTGRAGADADMVVLKNLESASIL